MQNAKPFAEHPELDADRSDLPGHRVSVPVCRDFQKRMHRAGLVGITWPTEYGGQGLGTAEQVVWNELSADYEVNLMTWPFVVGLGMPGPTILALGTEQQKKRYLPKLLSGDEIWC